MTKIAENINKYREILTGTSCNLIAISKTKPNTLLQDAYDADQRDFGENKVQELARKYEELPKDIRWHMVGHLQRNKVKFIAPFVHLIHSVDSVRLLETIEKEGAKANRVISVLLQVHIAREEAKFGFDRQDLLDLIASGKLSEMSHIKIQGLMGMATNTQDESVVKAEFEGLKSLFDELNAAHGLDLRDLSMGMSGDFKLAVEAGSTMIRIGTDIFGARDYANKVV
ncbi:MAG: YggS family pyridoxal phosphate-dependent enzyme [Cytophagales bacterium]|nr:YggS family pyridoxal phosphate-dependent enzyme [Cytophagales bacterium]